MRRPPRSRTTIRAPLRMPGGARLEQAQQGANLLSSRTESAIALLDEHCKRQQLHSGRLDDRITKVDEQLVVAGDVRDDLTREVWAAETQGSPARQVDRLSLREHPCDLADHGEAAPQQVVRRLVGEELGREGKNCANAIRPEDNEIPD